MVHRQYLKLAFIAACAVMMHSGASLSADSTSTDKQSGLIEKNHKSHSDKHGPKGPTGPKGQTGPNGSAGPTGPTGPAGSVTANFISSFETVQQSDFTAGNVIITFGTDRMPNSGTITNAAGVFTTPGNAAPVQYLITWSLQATTGVQTDFLNIDVFLDGGAISPSPFYQQTLTNGVQTVISGSVLLPVTAAASHMISLVAAAGDASTTVESRSISIEQVNP